MSPAFDRPARESFCALLQPRPGLFLGLVLLAVPLGAQSTPTAPVTTPGIMVDRVLAVVDDDPILASDVEQAIGLGLVRRESAEDDRALRRRTLDRLIEQRLRFHEVDRFGFSDVPVEEVEAQLDAIRAGFPDSAALARRLAELGMTEDLLRQTVLRQIMVLTYVEERVGPRVFVGLDEIRAYYETTLAAEMTRANTTLPPIDEVRESIRLVLREQRLNDEIERWTEELRAEAEVVDHFDRESQALPPLRFEIR